MNRALVVVAVPVIGVVVFFAAVAGVMLVSVASFLNSPFDDASFDRQVWLEHRGNTDAENPRGTMVADLCENRLQPGMEKAEVLDLLGPVDVQYERQVSYVVGMWSGFGIDVDTLDLTFDDSGRLLEVRVVQH